MIDIEGDVPGPIDLRLQAGAIEWERTVMLNRPWRIEFFDCFAAEIARLSGVDKCVLELGSGPGFLALHLLKSLPELSYVMLDFSPAIHQLAQARLGALAQQVTFIERSFKEPGWHEDLGLFNCVVTLQAAHELRHKRHARALH